MNVFINPYNFIPMEKTKSVFREEKADLNGVISYTVYTKTPLYIPNTSNDHYFAEKGDEPEHKSYDFYSYTNLEGETDRAYHRPVIPGSEIRGMFRNNYEILTNSCMSALDSTAVLSRRTLESFQAGLIFRKSTGQYSLYKAEDILWRTKGENSRKDELDWKPEYYKRKCYVQDDLPEGTRVQFEAEERERGKTLASGVRECKKLLRGRTDGYILKGADGPEMEANPNAKIPPSQKHCCHIFSRKNHVVTETLSLDTLDLILDEYEKNSEGRFPYQEYKEKLTEFREGKGNEYFPVYYSRIEDGKKVILMLSPACKTREIYQNNLKSLAGTLAPCTDQENLCPACALFGTLLKEDAVTSRLRFTDLQAEDRKDNKDYYYGESVTLPPMSSPKLNNMEFYLKRPGQNAWFWTYDYYVDAKGEVHIRQAELAGRKFYWHNLIHEIPSDERGKLNITIRPVAAGCSFEGKIYFNHLSERELDRLLYVINAGEPGSAEEKKHGYKLGGAKPFGLGSIACEVTEVKTRKYVSKDYRVVLEEEPYNYQEIYNSKEIASEKLVKNYGKMTDFEAVPKGSKISYPKTEEQDEGYAWFVANHYGYNRKNGKRTAMPGGRKDMVFLEYMEPMEPVLKSVGIPDGSAGSSGKSHNRKSGQPQSSSDRLLGTIKTVIADKKIGFIKGKNGSDLFFSAGDCPDFSELKRDDSVSYVLGKNKKGDCAKSVKRV